MTRQKTCVEDEGTKQVIRNVTEILRCEPGMKKGGNAKYNSRPFKGTGFFYGYVFPEIFI